MSFDRNVITIILTSITKLQTKVSPAGIILLLAASAFGVFDFILSVIFTLSLQFCCFVLDSLVSIFYLNCADLMRISWIFNVTAEDSICIERSINHCAFLYSSEIYFPMVLLKFIFRWFCCCRFCKYPLPQQKFIKYQLRINLIPI